MATVERQQGVTTLETAWSAVQRAKQEAAAQEAAAAVAAAQQQMAAAQQQSAELHRPRHTIGGTGHEEIISGLQRALVTEQERAITYKQQLGAVKRQHMADVAAMREQLGEAEKQLHAKVQVMARSLACSDQEMAGLRRALELEQGRSASYFQQLEAAKKEHHTVATAMRDQLWEAGRAEREVDTLRKSLIAGKEEVADVKVLLVAAQGRAAQLERMLEKAGATGAAPDQISVLKSAAAAELDAALQAAERRRNTEMAAMARDAAVAARELNNAQRHVQVLQAKLREKEAEATRLAAALTGAEKQNEKAVAEIKRLHGELAEKEAEVTRLESAVASGKLQGAAGVHTAEVVALHDELSKESLDRSIAEAAAAKLAAARAQAAAELAAALKAAEQRRQAEVTALTEQAAGLKQHIDHLQMELGDRDADLAKVQAALAGSRKQGADAIDSLQQQLEQLVSGWMQGALSAVQTELNVSMSSLQTQMQEACRKEGQNQRRLTATAPALIPISVGAGRSPTTPTPGPGPKAAMAGSRQAPARMMAAQASR